MDATLANFTAGAHTRRRGISQTFLFCFSQLPRSVEGYCKN